LRRLQLDFTAGAPGVDEVHEQTEKPEHRATRLAEQKCNALANHFPNQIVIGSDQVAACNNEVLDKPGSIPVAIDQLQRMTGQTVTFYTAVNMQRASDNKRYSHVDLTTVTLRSDLSKEVKISDPLTESAELTPLNDSELCSESHDQVHYATSH